MLTRGAKPIIFGIAREAVDPLSDSPQSTEKVVAQL
jgi:hypothetical protein